VTNSQKTVDLYQIDPLAGTFVGASINMQLCGGFYHNPSVTMAFLPCAADGTIRTYSIQPSNGVLAQTQAVTTTAAAGNIAMDPNGRFLLSMDSSGTITALSIAADTGVITPQGSPLNTSAQCNYPVNLAIDSTGSYAYVDCYKSGGVAIFSLNSSTGQPTYVGFQSSSRAGAAWVGASPTAPYVYIADQDSSYVSAYSINAGSGLLTFISDISVQSVGQSVAPDWGSFDATGSILYTLNFNNNPSESALLIGSNGMLTPVTSQISNLWDGPYNNITNFVGLPFGYVGNGASITQLNVNVSTGVVTRIADLPSATNGAGSSLGLQIAVPK
jgi:6-phosphogluconolactonase (cycloisomerase 2 family)